MSKNIPRNSEYYIKLYHGYGHSQDLVLYGHVFAGKPQTANPYSKNILTNTLYLLRLFAVKPVSDIRITLKWGSQILKATTESDGFIKFEWESLEHLEAGWYEVNVSLGEDPTIVGKGRLFVPHITQYGFISDIDDTVLISHSATIWRRLRTLFTTNPRTRKAFPGVAEHYRLLSMAHTTDEMLNPFFYVSSSEWNLYDYLVDFFRHQGLPEGAFLLNQVKRWYEIFKTGKTKHNGKLLRVMRILDTFPNQQFILLGDNTQQDPVIYSQVATKYPERIHAIYIRNASSQKTDETRALLDKLQDDKGVFTCLFDTSEEAIAHSRSIGLINA
ncbi:MAG: App1 family protein [Chitinophagaceae bacterium]|nr:App1 family protein [Chitinophagaceae bacterium]